MNPLTILRRWFADPDYRATLCASTAVAAIAIAMVAGLLLILRGLS